MSLPIVPVAWFIAMKATGTLNMGTQSIPLSELTPEFLREEVSRAFEEQTTRALEEVMKMLSPLEPTGRASAGAKQLLMRLFSPATRAETALGRELVAAIGGDFEIFRQVAGRHLLTGEPVRADLLCFPKQHLRDRGFEPGWFVRETKHIDFARDESKRLYGTF